VEGDLSHDASAPPTGGALVLRLHPWVEAYPAPSGEVYLMRPGWGPDVVIREPSPADRSLLERLARGAEVPAGGAEAARLAGLVDAGLVVERSARGPAGQDGERFDRQLPYLDGYGEPGAAMARLRAAHVVVIGCGGLGTWALAALASLGVGRFTLADDDAVELSNLNRQILFGVADVGRSKVERSAAWLARFDPAVEAIVSRSRVGSVEDAARLVADASLVVLAADWPPYELGRWVNAACVAAGVPFVTAGQQPPLLRIGPTYLPGDGACFACHERTLSEAFPRFAELAEHRRRHGTTATTLGPASGLIGCVLALEALHLLTGAPDRLATRDRSLLLDIRTLETHWETIQRRPGCEVCG
jgi:bacteriocin biosynthesis cyclodehydratase domain-containing protein